MSTFMGRGVATAMLGLVAAMALSSCSSASSADPTTVLKNYVTALNAGDFQEALSLVSEPGEMTSDHILNPGSVEVPEPLASGEAPSSDQEVADLSFDFSGEEQSIEFVKSNGEWKLRNPEFLVNPEPSSSLQNLIDLGGVVELEDGSDPFAFDYVVFDNASVPVSTQVVSEWFDPFDVPDTMLNLTADKEADIKIGGDPEQVFVTSVSEALRQDLIEKYDGVVWSSSHTSTEMLEFPTASECTVRIKLSVLLLEGLAQRESTPECTGGLMRLTVDETVSLRPDSNSDWKELPAGHSVEGPGGGILAHINLITGTIDARSADYTDELWAELFK